MALRVGWLESIRGLAGILAAVRARLRAGVVVRGPGGFHASKVELSRKGVDRRMQARVEARKSLAILYHRTTQIR